MQRRIDQLERVAGTFANQSYVDEQLSTVGNRVALVDDTVSAGVSNLATVVDELTANVTAVNQSVVAIRAALQEAIRPISSGTTPVLTRPAIVATNNDVVVRAPGSVRLESASCAVDGRPASIPPPYKPSHTASARSHAHSLHQTPTQPAVPSCPDRSCAQSPDCLDIRNAGWLKVTFPHNVYDARI